MWPIVLPVCRAPLSSTTGVSAMTCRMDSSMFRRIMARYSPVRGEFASARKSRETRPCSSVVVPLKPLLEAARGLLDCECDDSCHLCLRDFDNERFWDDFKRKPVLDWLKKL
ncbi:MAG TPA: hypothetical protein VJA26_10200, partial [Gammaproteobacteria bacterium]|nr:hypothetical protein [Gammaproteobacteria bacterium]